MSSDMRDPENSVWDRARASTAARRTVVVAAGIVWLTLVPLTIMGTMTEDDGEQSIWWWIVVAIYVALWQVSRVLGGDIAERRGADVDEYEMELRHRARSIGFVSAMILAAVTYLIFSFATRQARTDDLDLLLRAPELILVIFLAPVAIPGFFIAWTTRTDLDE